MNKRNLYLIPDAAEGVDPLDVNVGDVDISYPLLPATYYRMQFGDCTKVPNKDQTGEVLVIPFKTTEKVQDIKGAEVLPGLTIRHYVSLTPTEKYPVDSIKKAVSRIARACGLSVTVRQIMDTPSLLNGKFVDRVKLKLNKETAEFSASNSIGQIEVPGE